LKFGIFGNVQGKSYHHKKTDFGKYLSGIPRQYANMPVIMRCLWTSFDFLTGIKHPGGLSDEHKMLEEEEEKFTLQMSREKEYTGSQLPYYPDIVVVSPFLVYKP
jgi:hypothetical protein